MIKNYFIIGWRNILKNKGHSAINILGLALGIACCLVIFLWVQDERSIDNFHANKERLFTIYQTDQVKNGLTNGGYFFPLSNPAKVDAFENC